MFAVTAPHVHMNILNYAPIFIHSGISRKFVDVSHCTSSIRCKILAQCVPRGFKEVWARVASSKGFICEVKILSLHIGRKFC